MAATTETDWVTAHYLIETASDLQQAAATMAGEQSAGTFVKVPGESESLQARHGATVERVEELGTVAEPSLPGARPGQPLRRARVTLSFPLDNIGTSLSGLFTAVSGNLFELAPFSGLRLLDLELPAEFSAAQPGPAFGIDGTRRLAGVEGRPLIGTIIKPSVGLTPAQTAGLVRELCDAGLDFIKDDELQSHNPHSPFNERFEAVQAVLDEHAERSGKRVMYAWNITGEIDEMLERHDRVLAAGGTCVMVNMLATGLAGIQKLRQHARLPIHGHRAGWGALSRHPLLGFSYPAWQQVHKLAGIDHLHVNGLSNKFCESDESVIASARAVQAPINGSHRAMPVFSSGQVAARLPDTFEVLGNGDFMFLAGGGILAHPGGPGAGVQSLLQAWEAAEQGVPLAEYARNHKQLREALDTFGH